MDAKLGFDDNAEFRQEDIFSQRDISQEEPSEVEAQASGLNFIKLDGSIGCLVNGAGLAMATMDVLTLHGGQPANFLDVGGGATPETVKKAFQILLRDPKVKSIFINIFGGIMRCDYIAEGVISAAKELKMNIPLIVRLKGTKEAEAKECVFLFFPDLLPYSLLPIPYALCSVLYLHLICSVLTLPLGTG